MRTMIIIILLDILSYSACDYFYILWPILFKGEGYKG